MGKSSTLVSLLRRPCGIVASTAVASEGILEGTGGSGEEGGGLAGVAGASILRGERGGVV